MQLKNDTETIKQFSNFFTKVTLLMFWSKDWQNEISNVFVEL